MATDRQEAVRSVASGHEPGAGVISAVEVLDVRFPTSSELDGSDAMNRSPDYSAAYIRLRTGDGETGYSLVFTVGRGNDLQLAAVEAMRPLVVGRDLSEVVTDMAGLGLAMTAGAQMRWLGPNKGVIHIAAALSVHGAPVEGGHSLPYAPQGRQRPLVDGPPSGRADVQQQVPVLRDPIDEHPDEQASPDPDLLGEGGRRRPVGGVVVFHGSPSSVVGSRLRSDAKAAHAEIVRLLEHAPYSTVASQDDRVRQVCYEDQSGLCARRIPSPD